MNEDYCVLVATSEFFNLFLWLGSGVSCEMVHVDSCDILYMYNKVIKELLQRCYKNWEFFIMHVLPGMFWSHTRKLHMDHYSLDFYAHLEDRAHCLGKYGFFVWKKFNTYGLFWEKEIRSKQLHFVLLTSESSLVGKLDMTEALSVFKKSKWNW